MVQAVHVLEHLSDPWAFFRECWRVLEDRGVVHLSLPSGASDAAIGDLTHLRQYTPGSFGCFEGGYGEKVFNPQYTASWDTPFEIRYILQRINGRLRWWFKPVIRRLAIRVLPFVWNGFVELSVTLMALKSQKSLVKYKLRSETRGATVPVAPFMYKWEYEGRQVEHTTKMIFFGPQAKELQSWADND